MIKKARIIIGGALIGSVLAGVAFNDWRMTAALIGGGLAGWFLGDMVD